MIVDIEQSYKRLKENQVFKNYKEMCEYLSQPVLQGNSKVAQFSTFDRYFESHKEGHKIIIDSIYSEPLTEESRGIFSPLIQKLVLDYLCIEYKEYGRNEILITKSQLSEKIGLVKCEYKDYLNKQSELSELLNIPKYVVSEFYDMTNGKISDYYTNAFSALKRQSIIDFKQTYILSIYDSNIIRKPTEKESSILLEAEYYAKRSLTPSDKIIFNPSTGVEEMYEIQDIVVRGLWKEYVKLMNSYTLENGMDYVDYFYKGYSIILSKNVITARDRLDRYIIENKKEVMDNLNCIFVDRYKESYTRLQSKAKTSIESKDKITSPLQAVRMSVRADEKYASNGEILIDATINRKSKFIDCVKHAQSGLIIQEQEMFDYYVDESTIPF